MIATSTTEPDRAVDAHETSGPPTLGDVDSFASHAELARTLVEPGGTATLSTLTRSGHPYASVAPYSACNAGAPLICVSTLAEHTQNLLGDPRASVLVEAPVEPGVDPLSAARVTVVGTFVPVEPTDSEIAAHLEIHPFAKNYVHFADFTWWRLEISQLRYVGGFGVMGWTTGADYAAATADPIIPHAAPMIAHLDADHADACRAIVTYLAGVAGASFAPVSSIDRYGLTLDALDDDGRHLATARVAFDEALHSPDDVRAATVRLVHRARQAATDA